MRAEERKEVKAIVSESVGCGMTAAFGLIVFLFYQVGRILEKLEMDIFN